MKTVKWNMVGRGFSSMTEYPIHISVYFQILMQISFILASLLLGEK